MIQRRVLVTGAAGFVGRHVCRRFAAAQWRVIGAGHGTWSQEEARAQGVDAWHTAEITFDTLVNVGPAVDAIVHCAGAGSVGHSVTHPFQDFRRSCASIAATLEYARLHAPEARIVFLSSAAVYGCRSNEAIPESAPIAPFSTYGMHKSIGESLCRLYGDQYGVASTIVRLFSVYGPGLRKQLLWDACAKSSRGDLQFGGSGAETRDWLEISDATELILRAIEWAAPACPTVNGGYGEAPTICSVLTELLAELGVRRPPSFSGISRPGDPLHYWADTSAARARGWTPKIHWREGVRDYARWYRSVAP